MLVKDLIGLDELLGVQQEKPSESNGIVYTCIGIDKNGREILRVQQER